MTICVQLLGGLQVSVDGEPREVTGERLRTLVARLALAGGDVVPVAALAGAVWDGDPPADDAAALQSLVSRLRRALGAPDPVLQQGRGYRLAVRPGDVDALEVPRLLDDGKRALRDGDPDTAAALLGRARKLWRGEPAAELPAAEVHRLQLLREDLAAVAVEADLLRGRAPEALPDLERAGADHPLDERYAGLLVRALAATGRPAQALAAYERLRSGLADELGLDPSPELQAQHLELLRREDGGAPAPRLRASWTSFIGRDADLTRVAGLLANGRLVTVLGPGGAGKTRLAAEVGRRETRPVWFVELAPVTDPAEVPQAVLSVLGRRDGGLLDTRTSRPAREATGLLLDALAATDALLVLDNCEHLLDAVAALTDALLAGCPGLRVLATSREPLAIVGETLAPLPPLPLPPVGADVATAVLAPSVQLLVDRAAAVQPTFTVDTGNVAAIVEIVRRLDGLPLAIELAAARLRTLPVAEVARRLSDRFRLLTGGSRTALPRHRTLRAVVAWSWDLLTPPERLLADRLAVLVGGISTAAATEVCGGEGLDPQDVPDLLAALVDRSLLEQVGGDAPRYRMLETIREYGAEQLGERAELGPLRERYADHFAALATAADRQLRTGRQVAAIGLLRTEHDNLLAALRQLCDAGRGDDAVRLALDLCWYWQLLGRDAEAATWLGAALDVPGTQPGLRAQADVVHRLSSMSLLPSRPPATLPTDVAALARSLAGQDLSARPAVALSLPILLFFGGDVPAARRELDRLAADPDEWLAAMARLFRARTAENDGDLALVLADAEAALAVFRRLPDQSGVAATLPLIALVRQYDGDLTGALAALHEAEDCSRALGRLDVRDELFLLFRLIDLQVRVGDVASAERGCGAARALAARNGSPELLALTRAMTGSVARLAGDLDRAAALQELADNAPAGRSGQFSGEHGTAIVGAAGALLDLARGRLTEARVRLGLTFPPAVATDDLPILAFVGVAVATLAARRDQPGTAARALGAAARLRGADDPTNPDIVDVATLCRAALGDLAYRAAYDEGRGLDRAAATAALDPAALDPAARELPTPVAELARISRP